jgi:hypothetical protein
MAHSLAQSSLPSPFAITGIVFFRHDFGDRFLTPAQLSGGALALGLCAVLLRFLAGSGHFALTQPVPVGTWLTWLIFSLAFLICGSLHILFAAVRRTPKRDDYSYSDGKPWPVLMKIAPFVYDEWDFEMFFEPAVCIAAGALLIWFRNWFGVYLIICGISIYNRTSTRYHVARETGLGILDGRLAAEQLPDFDHGPEEASLSPVKPFGTGKNHNGDEK